MQSLENEDVTSLIPSLAAPGLSGLNAAASKEPVKHDEAPTTDKGTCLSRLSVCDNLTACY